MQPPHNAEHFLAAIFESTKRSGRQRPSVFDVAFLVTRHQSEFGRLAIPSLVQKMLFPAVLAIAPREYAFWAMVVRTRAV